MPHVNTRCVSRDTENAGLENVGPSNTSWKMWDWKTQYRQSMESIT